MKGNLKTEFAKSGKGLLESGTCALAIIAVVAAALWFLGTRMFAGAFP